MLKKPPRAKGGDGLADRMKAIAARPAFGVVDKPVDYVDVGRREHREERSPVYKHAVITLPLGEKLDVVVKDYSAHGARVEFFRRVELPETVLISEPSSRLKTYARVVWQREGVAGLRFIEGPAPPQRPHSP